jgi:hypothetical protein
MSCFQINKKHFNPGISRWEPLAGHGTCFVDSYISHFTSSPGKYEYDIKDPLNIAMSENKIIIQNVYKGCFQ